MPTGATAARIAGFLGASEQAWPGRSASTILLSGCQMRCPYCDTHQLITTTHRSEATLADILAHVDHSRHLTEGVVIGGGEPTMDPALPELLHALRAEGVPVKLDTNGAEPDVLELVIEQRLVDFVALDVKTSPARYDAVTGLAGSWDNVRRSVRMLIDRGIEHEFRTTCYPLAVSLTDLSAIAHELAGGSRFVLQQFRIQRTLDPAARSVSPYPASELARAVDRCNPYLPTVVRGA